MNRRLRLSRLHWRRWPLRAAGPTAEAHRAASFLAELQSQSGSVGVRPSLSRPAWTTSLAILTWLSVEGGASEFRREIELAKQWTLDAKGVAIVGENEAGHDGSLIGWSWAENTHSWIEPTIFHVLSLKALGLNHHPRVREAIRMLIDRQLPGGGCNYGNTTVMGQLLRPHLQPSGMMILALSDEETSDPRWNATVAYAKSQVNNQTTSSSLSWALLGLTAAQDRPADAGQYLAAAFERTMARGGPPHTLTLLAHAHLGTRSPLCQLPFSRMANT